MKNSLSTTGLSLTQAQSISNLCNQAAAEINNKLTGINNYSRSIKIDKEIYIETPGKKIPSDIKELILEKSKLHACQAFLMENIKAKDELLKQIKNKNFTSDLKSPIRPNFEQADLKGLVDETWGWNQLTVEESCEFFEQTAFAAHIGQFIHAGEPLDKLRKQLPTIKTLEWLEVKQGERTPMTVNIHHTSEQLLTIHESLASLHRGYEMRVNYFKAKVKNLVTEENARISKENALEQARVNSINQKLNQTYGEELAVWNGVIDKDREVFEGIRQNEIKAIAALRITVNPRFQEIVDKYTTVESK